MSTILFMISVALILSISFVGFYIWSVSNGQFDDLSTPALRMLKEDIQIQNKTERKTNEPG